MTVTRSKRRNVPSEERVGRAKPVVVSRNGMSREDKASAIMMAILVLVFLVLIVMAECSSGDVEASVAEPITKSRAMESDEGESSDQSLEDVIDQAFSELGSAVDKALDELGRAIDDAFSEPG